MLGNPLITSYLTVRHAYRYRKQDGQYVGVVIHERNSRVLMIATAPRWSVAEWALFSEAVKPSV